MHAVFYWEGDPKEPLQENKSVNPGKEGVQVGTLRHHLLGEALSG